MALDKVILISNPGSMSRKYAVYRGPKCLASFHFETINKKVMISSSFDEVAQPAAISHITFSATVMPDILKQYLPQLDISLIRTIALRVVAPSSFFQRDHELNSDVLKRLGRLQNIAPLHINATLSEYSLLKKTFKKAKFIGVSDSAFLADRPDHTIYYGIPLDDAQKYDIKRFGYHGISFESVVTLLKKSKQLSPRMVVCHLGGGSSVAAINNGAVIDSTMGYSPLEGLLMSTRSGSIDMIAFEQIKSKKRLSGNYAYDYFNSRSGLLGVSGYSGDIRELLAKESNNDRAKLAMEMYVYKIQQSIAAMAAAMNGIDALVFTGTVGERSDTIRQRVVAGLHFLGLLIDGRLNKQAIDEADIATINNQRYPAKIFIVKTNEMATIAKHARFG